MLCGNLIGLSYNDISLAFTVMLELMSYMPELPVYLRLQVQTQKFIKDN